MAEKLLDFSQPFDVGLLDATVAAFYGTGSKEEVNAFVIDYKRYELRGLREAFSYRSPLLIAFRA